MSVLWSSQFSGGGGIWRTKSLPLRSTIASGYSADVVYTPPAGMLVKLNYLAVQDNGATQAGIGIKSGSTVIVSNKTLINANMDNTASTFGVANGSGGTFINRSGGSMPTNIIGDTITITRQSSTTQIIEVGIEYGAIE